MASALSDSRKRLRSPSSSSVCSSPKRPASEDPPDPLDQRVLPPLSNIPLSPYHSAMVTTAQSLPDEPADTLVNPSDRLRHITGLQKAPFKVGDTWYLVSKSWWRRFEIACTGRIEKGEQVVSHDDVRPVDNSDLFDGDELKAGLTESQDVELLPQEAWDALVRWYGPPSQPIARPVLALGPTQTILSFYIYEFHLFTLTTDTVGLQETTSSLPQASPVIQLFAREPISHLYKAALLSLPSVYPEALSTSVQKLRMWRLDEKPSPEILNRVSYPLGRLLAKGGRLLPVVKADNLLQSVLEAEPTLQDCLLSSHDMLLIERASEDGHFVVPQPETVPGNTSTVASPLPRNDSLPETTNSPGPLVPLFGSGATPPGQEKKDFFSRFERDAPRSPSTLHTVRPASQAGVDLVHETVSGYSKGIETAKNKEQRGTVGLANLGNTCFMNSALQCLAHTEELVEYFLSGVFRTELNPTNPLGMGGQIAESFGALLTRLWSPVSLSSPHSYSSTSYAPREFKSTLARFAPQFSGYAQHDSQELLAFLLDGLHEDLNRVIKKPYIEKPDWPGEGTSKQLIAFARECWDGYLKRNDSVIVDLFQGQYKSTLVCPECEMVSITFDPYMYLTLPLPVSKKWRGTVCFVPWVPESTRKKISLELPKDADFRRLKERVAELTGCKRDHLLAVEPYEHRFWKFFEDGHCVAEVGDKDIIAIFEMPCSVSQPPARDFGRAAPVSLTDDEWLIVPILLAQPRPARSSMDSGSRRAGGSTVVLQDLSLFGDPFILAVTKDQASDLGVLYNLIVQRVSKLTENGGDMWRNEHQTLDTTKMPELGGSLNSDARDNQWSTPLSGSERDNQDIAPSSSEHVVKRGGDAVKSPMTIADNQMTKGKAPLSPSFLPARKGLFKMHLLQHAKDADEGVLVSGWSYESTTRVVNWEERQEEVHGLRVLPGGFREELEDDQANGSTRDEPELAHPLIRLGEAILCEWNEDAQRHYFDRWTSSWEPTEEILDPELKASDESARASGLKPISLYDCLSEFTREERLGADDLWYCPRCKKHQQATKRFEIWSVPDILVVHLKRFSSSRSLRDKLDVFVDFPVDGLNLDGRVEQERVMSELKQAGLSEDAVAQGQDGEPLLYDLFAVDEHLGGLGGGHYRAYARNYADEEWYHFDDSHVSHVSDARQAVNSNAYLLFYRRRTSRPLGGKTHKKIEQARRITKTSREQETLPGPVDDPFTDTPSSLSGLVLPLPMPGYSAPDASMHSPTSSDTSSSGSGGPAYSPPSLPSLDVASASQPASSTASASAASGLDAEDIFPEPATRGSNSADGRSISGDFDDSAVATPSDLGVDNGEVLDRLAKTPFVNVPAWTKGTWEGTGSNGDAWTNDEYGARDGLAVAPYHASAPEVEMSHAEDVDGTGFSEEATIADAVARTHRTEDRRDDE